MPSALRILINGQKPVNADWNKLRPTNAVIHNRFVVAPASSTGKELASTTPPATAKTILLIVMVISK